MWMILLSTALAAPLHHAPPPSLDAGFGMVDPVLVPGTSLLLTGDRALAVWDLEAGALRARLPVRGVGHESTEQTALQPWALQGGGMVRVVRDELARWPLDGSGPTDVLQARSGPVLDVHARGILVEDSDAPGLRLVDSDGQTVWTRALDDTPWAAAFRADGGAVAVTIGSDPVLVLDAETGEVRRRLETALDEDVTGLHWQGDTLLAYGRHGSARAWGPRATRPSAQADFTGALRGQQYGRVLAHDGDQWTILTDRLWVGRPGALAPLPSPCPAQAAEGAAVRTLPAGGDGARISVSPQGICLHGPTPRMLPVGATEVMTDVDWGPDRRLLTTGSRLLRWELDQGEATVLPLGGDRPPDQLSATADLATVASAALGGWGPVAGWPARRVALPADARAVALAPDGSGLLVSTHRGLVAVSSDGQRQETVAGPRSGHQLAWGGAGRLAWQGTLWADPGTGFAEVAGADTLLGGRTAPSPRGDQALWATDDPVPGGPTHQLHRGGAGGPATVVATLPAGVRSTPARLALSPRGDRAAVLTVDDRLLLVDLDHDRVLATAALPPATRRSALAFSPDGRVLAVAGDGLRLFPVAGDTLAPPLVLHPLPGNSNANNDSVDVLAIWDGRFSLPEHRLDTVQLREGDGPDSPIRPARALAATAQDPALVAHFWATVQP